MTVTLNPQFSLSVNGTKLTAGVQSLVESVVFEDADGIADCGKIVLKNPDYVISDNKTLAIGNEVSIYMGYEGDLKHIGRIRIYKHRPIFPRDEMPSIEITGYSRDHEMMHYSSPQDDTGTGKKRSDIKRHFTQKKYSEAVSTIAPIYKFQADIDETPDTASDFIQMAGMTDYDFVDGLANITGFIFWVDGDENGTWTLHFKNPETMTEQDTKFKFEHNAGNLTTLFEFEPEFLVSESMATIRARFINTKTGNLIEAEFSEDSDSGSPDVKYDGGTPSSENINQEVQDSESVQIYIGDYSFYEVTNRQFETEAELTAWVKQWFRRSRENFIFARGLSIGVTSIKSREVHELTGVGKLYSGEYYFSRVAHKIDNDGYTLDFGCRKQVKKAGA